MRGPQNRVCCLVLVLALIGCAHMLHVPQIDRRASVEVRESTFDREVTLIGLNDMFADLDGLSQVEIMRAPKGEFFLRSWVIADDGSIRHQIYVDIQYHREDWDFWTIARTENAASLDVTRIDSSVRNCSGSTRRCTHHEAIGLSVPHDTLERYQERGLRIRLSARSGRQQEFTLTAQQIKAQLNTLADVLDRP